MTPGQSGPAEPVGTTRAEPESADEAATFGALLRAHRHAARLTQSELAARSGLGIRTVRDLEHGRAARPQRTTVELLATALGLTGRAVTDFFAAARGHGPQPPAPPRPGGYALPTPPLLFGREEEVAALLAHLGAQSGLTTLVGLAGVGKSALALTAAYAAQPLFPGGAVAISIAAGDTAADIREVLCAVLDAARPAELPTRLQEPVLLMMDAADRSPEAFAEVLADVLAITPTLRVLASARAPLGLPGERVWPVGPLALPPAEASTLVEAEQHPASALFLARWQQVRRQGSAAPADVEVGALVALVRRLGGLPLAIELAAARGRVLDPAEMLARYGHRLLELGGADDLVTLRDVVTASYRLLEPSQRMALRSLSAFGYRWSIELAEELIGQRVDVVPALERLVDLGLVQVRGSGALRFVLLDVVREFAAEQAAAAGETAGIRGRHAQVFADFADRNAPAMSGATLAATVARFDDVASDLWTALAYAAEHEPVTALRLAAKLPRWWRFRGRDQQGRQWLRRLLDDPRIADADPQLRAWADLGVMQLAAEHGAGQAELPRAEQALASFVLVGDIAGELAARAVLQAVQQAIGAYDEARRHGEATLALATRTGRVRDMAIAQNNLIWHDLRNADLAAAQRRLAAVERLSARAGEPELRALARANLAEVLRLEGRFDESARVGLQAVEMLAEAGDPSIHRRRVLGVVGLAYAQGGRLPEAEKVLAEIRSQLGGTVSEPDTAERVEDWHCAMIEATLAEQRGHRTLAASWFTAAARRDGGPDLRDVVEALLGLVRTGADQEEALSRLWRLCESSGIVLTERQRAQLG
ncbi:XRE family transcriptional regulator [Catellatospora sp. TT07R-123]|uniref:ATP-binding protein n=1 Tax=Catellatospora sp. TT07R-123 TaxID=2733863 RepID=UPI001B219D17|nr:helix-turn-helix domain-containing protein [Catellatospora sp. TT07R-123]GHJ46632.1 XRE family transcriptional regulator [Catellatospora sp. TT07R-123]